MSTTASLDYLYGLARYGTKPGLVTMHALMAELGHPEQKFKSIHITGTNGKGSTAALLASSLQTAGYRTALYTSPHLYSFNERMLIDGQSISNEELISLIDRVRQAAERAGVEPTFFESTTAIAFTYFAEQGIDLAVVEVGMGGERDATNVITPEISVITNIDLDHTDIIGPTLADITHEKAGIIKSAVPVIVGQLSVESETIITARAEQLRAPLFRADAVQIEPINENHRIQTFQASGAYAGTFTMPLLGSHQLHNAAVALTALHVLERSGFTVSPAATAAGFKAAHWEGRLDIISEQPFILVDGAHNEASFHALHQFITDPATKLPSYDVLLTGLKQGKEAHVLRNHIAPLFKCVITTEGAYQPMPASNLADFLRARNTNNVEAIAEPAAALAAAQQAAGENGTLLVAGSLYLIPLILAHLRRRPLESPLVP